MAIRTGIVGYGYWGINLVRNFNNLDNCEVVGVADIDPARLKQLKASYPLIPAFDTAESLIADRNCDAIVIATPIAKHYELALSALKMNKHVLVEKPITTSADQLKHLAKIAQKNNRVLMVDHTFLYNGAVTKMKEIVENDTFGKILSIDSSRINLGIIQHDTNALWDLACHDLSIINFLVERKPRSVQANGVSHLPTGFENIAYITLKYDDGLIAHIHVSWSSPVKIRQMLVGGEHKMILYNDIEPTDKLKVYDKNYTYIPDEDRTNVLVDYRLGDILIPKFDLSEPLMNMVRDFYNAVEHGRQPVANWESGLDVVSILEKANQSMKSNGREIAIDP